MEMQSAIAIGVVVLATAGVSYSLYGTVAGKNGCSGCQDCNRRR